MTSAKTKTPRGLAPQGVFLSVPVRESVTKSADHHPRPADLRPAGCFVAQPTITRSQVPPLGLNSGVYNNSNPVNE